jgi:chromosome segregation ATPase
VDLEILIAAVPGVLALAYRIIEVISQRGVTRAQVKVGEAEARQSEYEAAAELIRAEAEARQSDYEGAAELIRASCEFVDDLREQIVDQQAQIRQLQDERIKFLEELASKQETLDHAIHYQNVQEMRIKNLMTRLAEHEGEDVALHAVNPPKGSGPVGGDLGWPGPGGDPWQA